MTPAPMNPAFEAYYGGLAALAAQNAVHEQATRAPFTRLLETYARPVNWTLVLEQRLANGKIPDGTLYDAFRIPRGVWEAKDTSDDLDVEIRRKIKIGYPLENTIFEDTRRGVLYQGRQRVLEADLKKPAELSELLTRYFSYTGAEIEEFHKAIAEFETRIPDLARGLLEIIEQARQTNTAFQAAFRDFHELCKSALNPGLGATAIEEMLVQHLLTERLFRNVFDNPEFTQRNVIAREIEHVIAALASQSFSRAAFLKSLDYFYVAIENTARTIGDFSEKQGFLNAVYERFFQGFSRAQADTHGIVYTPQPIVDFMCESVEHVLQTAFGSSLSAEGVTILDPCTGTGNFLVNILRRILPLDLPRKYASELFANEIMLLPYYIASLNIEHAYFEKMGHYQSFEGICFADTLDLAEGRQMTMEFSETNSARVKREKAAAITVIVGNPPYNVGQQNENDNNKNRPYGVIDDRIRETYTRASKATNKNALSDAYVKFFRWATDRLGDNDGIVCYVSNNGFLEGVAFDGFRKHLADEFTDIYVVNLGGNARREGGGNVFGIRVGVSINILVRRREGKTPSGPADIHYLMLDNTLTSTAKLIELKSIGSIAKGDWQTLTPNAKNAWLTEGLHAEYDDFLPLGNKETKASKEIEVHAIFKTYSNGLKSNRDEWVYDFDRSKLVDRIKTFTAAYNDEVDRWKREGNKTVDVDMFVPYDDSRLKWSRDLKRDMVRGRYAEFDEGKITKALFRPFCKKFLFFDRLLNEEVYSMPAIFPTPEYDTENCVIAVAGLGNRSPFGCLMTNVIPSIDLAFEKTQCFPLYTYHADGKLRRDNITDWALGQFQDAYGPTVTKRDIFYYVYALLHHPQYRQTYAENLKRDLPRLPLVGEPPSPSGRSSLRVLPPKREENSDISPASVDSSPPVVPAAEALRAGAGGVASLQRAGVGSAPGSSPASDPAALFRAFAETGAKLAALHVGFEDAPAYALTQIVSKDAPFSWRVTKMRLNAAKTAVVVNDSLTLAGLPPETFGYRLGNRSALEWVIDQHQAATDKRSGLASDPNRPDDSAFLANLVRKVVTVSVETVKLVAGLPGL